MTHPLRSFLTFSALAALLAVVPATMAQAPDCTGISGVHNTDVDFTNELTTVRIVQPGDGPVRPVHVTAPAGDTERLFIVSQDGQIWIYKNGAVLGTPFLDISAITRSPADGGGCSGQCEQGLLSLAFHPDYDTNGWFFVMHTHHDSCGSSCPEKVVRYTVDAGDPDLADASSRTEIISIPSTFSNHNGGMIAFSPDDGHLYIGTGDGGSGCDPAGAGQDLNSLNGKLLRLWVDDFDTVGYTTDDNPFDGIAGADEIWSYGLRNPYRWSFDRINSTIYIGDVGQFQNEEIDCQLASSSGGENYGWDSYEGNSCPTPGCAAGSCALADYVAPVIAFSHGGGRCSVTGGYTYQGCRMADLRGTYFYTDWCATSYLRSSRASQAAPCNMAGSIARYADLSVSGTVINSVSGFGEDGRGEIYIVDWGGEIYKILPTLAITEVSGPGAPPFLMDQSTLGGPVWFWEDLASTSGHDVTLYKVYRSANGPLGDFVCKHRGPDPSWVGGDPEDPDPDEVFYYLVTVLGAEGDESHAGTWSDGTTARVVDTASLCL